MFCRAKISGNRTYVRIVENRREGKKTGRRFIAGRLMESGDLNGLAASLRRFAVGGRRRTDGSA